MKSFAGKTLLVTGAVRGPGREMVLMMTSEEALVVIADLSLASCEEVDREIQLTGGRV